MSIRDESIAAYPEFPWLHADDAAGADAFLRDRNWLREGERVVACEKPGEGNMNLTLRLRTDQRTMILKQARPWVEKYDAIAAPWDRSLFEQRFYQRVATIPEVASRMPRVMATDAEAHVTLLEDLGDARDFTDIYGGVEITAKQLHELAAYLRALHVGTRGKADADLANCEMRALNHEHIFEIPLQEDNGVDLEALEIWLSKTASELRSDGAYCAAVQMSGERYLKDGPCLVQGDFFPGSWLRTDDGIKVIDPEFCFYGDPEFDLGVCVAHLRMSQQELKAADLFLDSYAGDLGALAFERDWVARYAATEVMRRIIGVAQLPIPPTQGLRGKLLKQSREALLKRSVPALWGLR